MTTQNNILKHSLKFSQKTIMSNVNVSNEVHFEIYRPIRYQITAKRSYFQRRQSNRQTDRQTDKPTDRQIDGRADVTHDNNR